MNTRKWITMMVISSALAISTGAMGSEGGTRASRPGSDGVPGESGGTGGCLFSYQIRKVGPSHAHVGDEVTYKIILDNLGNCDLDHIRVSDFFPHRTTFISANPAPTTVVDHKIVWDDQSIEAGDTMIFYVTVRVNPDDYLKFPNITNNGCAFSPLVGTKICDTASTMIKVKR